MADLRSMRSRHLSSAPSTGEANAPSARGITESPLRPVPGARLAAGPRTCPRTCLRASLWAGLTVGALVSGCGATNPNGAPGGAAVDGPSDAEFGPDVEELQSELPAAAAEAIDAIRAGDYTGARGLVEGLAFDAAVLSGRNAVEAGAPREALVPLDEALALRPEDPNALFLRGRAAFAAADGDPQAGFFYGEAAAMFEEAARRGYGVEAAFRASEAARLAGEGRQALELARQAMGWVDAKDGRRATVELDPAPERIWAQAAFDAYIATRNRGAAAGGNESPAELFAETEDALGRLAGVDPASAWPSTELAKLYLWEGRSADAQAALEQALELEPDDAGAHELLVSVIGDAAAAAVDVEAIEGESDEEKQRALAVARETARRSAIVDRYDTFTSGHPDVAGPFRTLGFERFYLSLLEFEAGIHDEDGFRRAEQAFRRYRELNPDEEEFAIGYEVICRNAIGWCRYWRDDLVGAETAFLSTEELLDRGLDWSLGERLPSSLAGLDFVTRKYAANARDPESMEKAAALADTMFARRPENGNLANNAGFLNRDAGVLFELHSRQKRAEAVRADDPETAAAARAEADRLRERAQTLMERSWAAYQVSAELSPDDVRLVNDAGLVQAYYLQDEGALEQARLYFMDAVNDGRKQLEETELEGQALADLEEAWGDAHQNLCILALVRGDDLVTARDWLAEALRIGPATRALEMTPMMEALDASIAAGKRTPELEQQLRRHVWTR